MVNDRIAGWLVFVMIATIFVFANPYKTTAGMLAEARKFSGLHEVTNNRKLRSILGINPARVPWCGYFMGYVAKKAGSEPPSNFTLARAWAGYGSKVSLNTARPGDVVVIRSRYGYHVGLLSEISKKGVHLIGGNQSGRVQQSRYSKGSVVAVRRGDVPERMASSAPAYRRTSDRR